MRWVGFLVAGGFNAQAPRGNALWNFSKGLQQEAWRSQGRLIRLTDAASRILKPSARLVLQHSTTWRQLENFLGGT